MSSSPPEGADRELLRRLVLREHLNVEERLRWGRERVRASEIEVLVREGLGRDGFFPPQARPWIPGEAVMEGYFLERLEDGRCRLHWQRHHALDPFTRVEGGQKDYPDEVRAVRVFVKKQFGKHIDGIVIEY